MDDLFPILHGYCTIELVKNINRDNFHPRYVVVGNTLVDEDKFFVLKYDANGKEIHWFMRVDPKYGGRYVYRVEHQSGKQINIFMAREILSLPRSAGYRSNKGDHENHDTLDNRLENLRAATPTQSNMNRKKWGACHRFPGVRKNNGKYRAHIQVGGSRVYFLLVLIEIEAGLMYYYASIIIHGEFNYPTVFPPDEIPNFTRQQELLEMVVAKLKEKGHLTGEWALA